MQILLEGVKKLEILYIEKIKKCKKDIIDSYIFSLYLSKLQKINLSFGFLFCTENKIYLLTNEEKIFEKDICNVENLLYVDNSILKNTNSINLVKRKQTEYLEYDYCEQIYKIINNLKKLKELETILSMYSLCSVYKPILVCFYEDNMQINQVKNCAKNDCYTLPLYIQNLKDILIEHNIYNLDNWDLFKRFSSKEISTYSFKIPDYEINHLLNINNKKYKSK